MAAAAPKVLLYGPPYPAKPADAHIEVYKAARPDVAFLEIAQISCRDTGDDCNMKQILMKAREVGADAIMIIGQAGPYGEDDALTAIAIRYK